MLNIDDFIKRLELLLDYYSISASVFADKVGVQRSGMSHLLSGRNKPSLDFVLKIVENFPDFKVKIVEHLADVNIKIVENFPNSPGKWKLVEHFPNFKIKIVDNFHDFTIKYVDHFPGVK